MSLMRGDSYMGPWWFWLGAVIALLVAPIACIWLFENGGMEWLLSR